MAENLHCSHCSNPATVHLTQIVNNKIIKVDLCESCAQAKGVTDPEGFSLADLLTKNQLVAERSEPRLTCPTCGLTTADFRRTGRLGCSACYQSFVPLLKPVLEDMHAGTIHKGKVPQVALVRQNAAVELQALQDALQRAIDGEAYEDAARYRDQIHAIQDAAENDHGEAVSR